MLGGNTPSDTRRAKLLYCYSSLRKSLVAHISLMLANNEGYELWANQRLYIKNRATATFCRLSFWSFKFGILAVSWFSGARSVHIWIRGWSCGGARVGSEWEPEALYTSTYANNLTSSVCLAMTQACQSQSSHAVCTSWFIVHFTWNETTVYQKQLYSYTMHSFGEKWEYESLSYDLYTVILLSATTSRVQLTIGKSRFKAILHCFTILMQKLHLFLLHSQ